MTGEDTSEIAALGRLFHLGMLYDSRKDALVPGITLWDHEQLRHNTDVRSQHNTEFKVTKEDSIEETLFSSLKVDDALKLTILGRLIDLNGVAKYFRDKKESFRQKRLTLHYASNTKFAQLTMDHLGRLAHPDVLIHPDDNNTATHVVTAVLYEAKTYFVFDRQVSSDEKNVNGEIKIALDKLKGVPAGFLQITLSIGPNKKEALEKCNCTFYGDFKLSSNPNTFEEAIKVYTDLAKILGENAEYAVPLKVWL
ncbi:LOW QUALITY PROTEIN: verrucotoxin subunit beta-like [Electrophorus electricus]|uniref:LOW QUALITY PROTEIN: verrucotoxin subunit beta-like n=1 Tax=Electrophorus electricus TaxID=8005 RepID=UPI0015D07EF2|nr:LOW QUALITY PROTEIN: verrucotoxin subunit beta-like [Electrophorus electricus]